MEGKKRNNVITCLDDEAYEWISKYARQRYLKVGQAIRQILRQFRDGIEAAAKQQQNKETGAE